MFGKLHLEMDTNRIFVFQIDVMFILMSIWLFICYFKKSDWSFQKMIYNVPTYC